MKRLRDVRMPSQQVNKINWWSDYRIMKWKDHKEMKGWWQDERMLRIMTDIKVMTVCRVGRIGSVGKIEFRKEKMEHPSRPVESTTGPCLTNSEKYRAPHTKSFPAPSLHHTTHYIIGYMDKSKIKRRKICRGKPILAQVSFPGIVMWQLVVVHQRIVVSLYNLISSIMEDHNNVTIKNMPVTSTSFLWYASRRKGVNILMSVVWK